MTAKLAPPKKVIETGSEEILFEPFFRTREEAVRIRRLQTRAERRKFADAFAMVGCIRCGTTQRPHVACGFCQACYVWYGNVLQRALRARQQDGDR